jgi:NitT/TauT family transport system substrate-binding protein
MTNRRLLAVGAALSLAVVLTGCSGGSSSDSATTSSKDTAGSGTTTNLTVGVLDVTDTAPLRIAIKEGYFAKEGLNVKTTPAPGAAQATAGLVSGQMQFAFGSYVPFILAASQGAPLRLASQTEMTSGVPSGLVVLNDSKAKTAADLKDAKIGVSALTNIGTLAISQHLSGAGVSPSSVHYVALPFPNMLAALQHKQVDAAWLVEPFLTQAVEAGARVLFDPFSAPMPDVPMAGYMTTNTYASAHPDIVKKFDQALQEAAAKATSDPQTFQSILPSYTSITSAVASKIKLNTFTSEASQTSMQQLADLMLKDGLLKAKFDVASFYR